MTADQPRSPSPGPDASGAAPDGADAPDDADTHSADAHSADAQGDDTQAAGADERVSDGVEHLQSAAREMIAAARTFLDVVEDVVGDHTAVASLADALGTVSQVVSRAASRPLRPDAGPARADGTGQPDGSGGSGVQHIDVS